MKGGCVKMKAHFKKFDIVLVDFGDDVLDSEQGGKRPAVIVQNNDGNIHSSTTLVMPLTKNILKKPNQPTHTLIKRNFCNNLKCDSMVLGECLRQISEKRILGYIGYISSDFERKNIKDVFYANFGD